MCRHDQRDRTHEQDAAQYQRGLVAAGADDDRGRTGPPRRPRCAGTGMSWNRANVASALVSVLTPVVGVKVHHLPPETLNPMCVVVGRPQVVSYATYAFGIDDAQLPLMIVGGIETEDQIEALKDQCRDTVLSNKTLGG